MAVPGKSAQKQFSSSTTSMGSDEDLKVYCQPCDRDGPRHHTLLVRNTMPQSMSTAAVHPSQTDNLTKPCPKHMEEMIKFYCLNHKALLCSVCVTIGSCKVNYIPDISDQVLASKDHNDILKVMDIISEQCCKKSENVRKMTAKSKSSLAGVLTDIKKFRKELNQRLDELERQVEDAAKQIQQENDKNLRNVETTCDVITKSLKTSYDTIKHLYTSKQADSLFIELKLAEKMIKDYEKRSQQLSVYDVKDYSFKPNKAISTLLEQERSMGTFTEKSLKQANPPPSADIRSRLTAHQGEICVKTSKDENRCWITGMTLLSPDVLILIDNSNNKSIKMVDTSSQSVTDQLQLDTSPYDVTSVTGTELAVTLPDKQRIQFVSVSSNKVTKKHTIKVKRSCYGISYCQGKLVVSFSNPAKLQILDINGNVLTTISGDNIFSFPWHVTANTNSIFVSDWNVQICTWFNWKGVVIGSSRGMYDPRGITLSDDGTVFVCDHGRNAIEEVSGDCSTGKVVLKGLNGPQAVCWCAETSKLYYSSYTRNEKHDNFLHIFKLS